eukprot:CAMPEP_0113496112 /NCGR_PEP_ID=MMETSP0014_2-20120614/29952_1 /TAXON_ID=2857 /ORGANISM="Nitzschia sp." /LENGTH=837 /DNA_ID=CAMNT_0000390021 /DNA_START=53 /DNA_END=2566 /DNA_ORIENTATION=+ /assembly_acc=CAM_ASM_000159
MVVRGLARRLDGIVRNNNNSSNMSNGNNNIPPPHPPVLVYDRHETNLIIDGTIVDSTTLAQALRSTGTSDDHGSFQIDDIDKFKTLTIRNISRVDQGVVDGMRKIIRRTIASTAAPTKAAATAEKGTATATATAKTTTATSSLKAPPPPPPAPLLPLPSSSSNEIYDIYSVYGPPPAAAAAAASSSSDEIFDIYSVYGPPPPPAPLPPPAAASSSSSNSENNNVKNCEIDKEYTEEECKHKKDSSNNKKNVETEDNKKKNKKWEKIELIHSAGPCVSKLIEEVLPYTDGFAYTGSVPLHRTRYNLDDSCLKVIGNVLMASDDTDHEEETGTGSGGSISSSTGGTTAASDAASADTKKDDAEEAKALPSPTIAFLSLKGTRLRGNGFEVLCRGIGSSTSLKRLELSNCSLEADDVGKLAYGLCRNKHLTYLGFAGCKFGSTISHVARRPSSSSVAEDHRQEEVQQETETGVVVPHNGLDQGQGQRQAGGVLHAAAHHPSAAAGGANDVDEINIDIQIDIGDDRSSDVESIVLSTNNTNPQTHFSQVLESLTGSNTLKTLKISGMYTNEASMTAIGALLSSPNSALKILRLKNNLPQHDGSIVVGPLLKALKHNKKLTNLQLLGNNVNDEVVDQLTTILAGPNKTLQGLVLSSNSIGNDGIRSFARRLPDFKSLKSLDLQRNENLDDDSKKALFAALEKNVVMLRLDIDNGADPKKIWWLTLNKAGRALLTKDQDIPPGLWPKIIHRALTMPLGRVHRITNLDVMHYFLRRGHEMFEHAVDKDDHRKNKKDEEEQSLVTVIDHSQKKRKIDSIVNTSHTDSGKDDGDNEPPNEKKPRAT